jgi:hypothetical protein
MVLNLVVKPAYAPASEQEEQALTARADEQGSGAADPWIDTGVQIGLAAAARKRGGGESVSPTQTQFGWTGAPAWRRAAAELDIPGTHETVGGRIPTQEEAVRMISHNGVALTESKKGMHRVALARIHMTTSTMSPAPARRQQYRLFVSLR